MTNLPIQPPALADHEDIAINHGIEDDHEAEIASLEAFEDEPAPKRKTMDFHVRMNSYTLDDFEALVIEAAARQLTSTMNVQREIKEAALDQVGAKVNAEMSKIAGEVMQQTAYRRGAENISISQAIGLEGRAYLTEMVDSEGRPSGGGMWSNAKPRAEYIVQKELGQMFRAEINQAFKELRTEITAQVKATVSRKITEEREAVSKALENAIKGAR
jgi:hypothetical protein